APRVVQPGRRQVLGIGRESAPCVLAQFGVEVLGAQMHVDDHGEPTSSGETMSLPGIAATRCRSGTGFQRLSSSNGSDATIATCSSTNVHSEWYQAVAQIPDSLHSNMFNRDSGASSSTSW